MTLRESYKELEQNFRAFTNERYCVFGFQGFYVVMFYLCATWKTKEHINKGLDTCETKYRPQNKNAGKMQH